MSKSKTQQSTAEALETASAEKAKAEQAVTDADHAFEHEGRTAAQHQRTIAAREELAFHTRVHALAQAEHAAFQIAESARIGAEIEAKRIAGLAVVEAQLAENIAESISAGQQLIRGMARGWELTLLAQSHGKTGPNEWQFHVADALARACIDAGLPTRAVRV